jgi:hypothetical protein
LSTGAAHSEDLASPLYVVWQLTNECNLACLRCIEESRPGKAFPDELGRGRSRPPCRTLAEAWEAYQRAWHGFTMASAVRDALADDARHALANTWRLLPLVNA